MLHSLWTIIIEVTTARSRTIFITRNAEIVQKVLISLLVRKLVQKLIFQRFYIRSKEVVLIAFCSYDAIDSYELVF